MVENRDTVARLNPFNMQPPTNRATTSPKPDAGFDKQLAQALSESLGRLGLSASGVNISIRNAGSSPSARQIVITWDADSANSVNPAETAAPSPAASASTAPSSEPSAAPAAPSATRNATPWCVTDGPCDPRDGVPAGGGIVSESGAPVIAPNETPTANQYGYTGPAARNPYYTNPSNPLRAGYVLGFDNWFRPTTLSGGLNGPMSLNKSYFATQDAANEALRLVQEYEPGAELTQRDWGSSAFVADNQMYEISLPGGGSLNAGMLLRSYYNNGFGVTAESDAMLQQTLGRKT